MRNKEGFISLLNHVMATGEPLIIPSEVAEHLFPEGPPIMTRDRLRQYADNILADPTDDELKQLELVPEEKRGEWALLRAEELSTQQGYIIPVAESSSKEK